MPITTGDLEFMNEALGSTIIYGDNEVELIVGGTMLESERFEADPLSRILKRFPATRLK
jgi:hypothetical protein